MIIEDHSYYRYKCNCGFFFIFDNGLTGNIHGCRETFAIHFDKDTPRIGFLYPNVDLKKVNRFWRKVEKSIKLKQKVVFHKTNIENVTVIDIPSFWLSEPFYRGLFTLLLRCSIIYYKGFFNEALDGYNLTSSIKNVILYFLKGNKIFNFKRTFVYTDYNEYFGVVNYFKVYSRDKSGKLLPITDTELSERLKNG